MDPNGPTPDRIMQIAYGDWAAILLATGCRCDVFTHIANGKATAEDVARAAGLSPRGTLALLDGLTGLGFLSVENGRYSNAPDAAAFLVEGARADLRGLTQGVLSQMGASWRNLPEVVQKGAPLSSFNDTPEHDFWEELVMMIVPLAMPAAHAIASKLITADAGPMRILDIGGGSGAYASVLLQANAQARSTQVDWPNVNRIAKDFAGRMGVGDRFDTVDGDFHSTEFGSGNDITIYANIAHQEGPEENVAIFKRVHAAMNPGGTFVISDFVINDDRTGHPFAMMFHANMLLHAPRGAVYRPVEYTAWLKEAGFAEPEYVPTPGPTTLIFARRQ